MGSPLVVANWKMNKSSKEAADFVTKILSAQELISDMEVVICPSFVSLENLKPMLANSQIKLGAQNIYHEQKGAYTGEVSAMMIAGVCDYVILGHSERRKYFHETSEDVHKKALLALDKNIKPIICIGESLEDRGKNLAEYAVRNQLEKCLEGFSTEAAKDITIAYEPIWAIGTGVADKPEECNLVCKQIRQFLGDLFEPEIAAEIRILYGGSVNAENIGRFVEMPEINGALVGGASLDADEFLKTIEVVKANNKEGAND